MSTKNTIRTVLLFAALLVLSVSLAACKGAGGKVEPTLTPSPSATHVPVVPPSPSPAPPTSVPNTGEGSRIVIQAFDYYFEPDKIYLTAGQKYTIEVVNKGKEAHTFLVEDYIGCYGGVLCNNIIYVPVGASASFSITPPGNPAVYYFHCVYHEGQNMGGNIYVQ